jgi:rhodanese-related sulfurtransferase
MAMAIALLKDSRLQEAEKSVRTAMRLDPHYPAAYLVRLAQVQFHLMDYPGAVASLEESIAIDSNDSWTFVYLAAAYGQLNLVEKARKALTQADSLRAKTSFGPITLSATTHRRFRWQGKSDALKDGLQVAGAPSGVDWVKLITHDGGNRKIKGVTEIDAIEAKAMHDRGALFIDTQPTWFVSHIPGAYFLEWWGMEGWLFNEIALGELADTNQEIVIYSSSLGKSFTASACALAVSRGFKKVFYFPGGHEAWKAAGYPLETNR